MALSLQLQSFLPTHSSSHCVFIHVLYCVRQMEPNLRTTTIIKPASLKYRDMVPCIQLQCRCSRWYLYVPTERETWRISCIVLLALSHRLRTTTLYTVGKLFDSNYTTVCTVRTLIIHLNLSNCSVWTLVPKFYVTCHVVMYREVLIPKLFCNTCSIIYNYKSKLLRMYYA